MTVISILHCKLVTVLLLTGLFVSTGMGAVYPGNTDLTFSLGDQLQSHVTIYNPASKQDTFSVTITPTMTTGKLLANFLVDSRETNTAEVKVSAKKNRSIQVSYNAASCTLNSCNGDVTITARSLTTGNVATADVPVTITRQREVYGSPGITWQYVVLLGVLAAGAVALRGQNGRRFRRRSDSPDK